MTLATALFLGGMAVSILGVFDLVQKRRQGR
jgi:hypothetical protein